ncbi:TlpA family protein disulfide reductase [Chitinophaga sancti]|uniref:Thiol-disulfide isomerase or thioredoxin n=1 Tax=Chitinophaga sancti TaxID=1004 RepID=A0A1K1SM03_9BACT|nr:TlpA disulfide reductase family protein [Chitinophaga sancti]WQD65466.1 TlpA disulfide reductase family protein [Chitinophaga sancti]WQG88911.1 TlpA disulfide reductase family protein [Chitinophaga sancti]SFW84909.1 Thiol-disulfide isomerase or thioredoxin [Chitinophaga sancti]
MKKTVLSMLMLAFSATGWAQHATINGKFIKEPTSTVNTSQIYLFKADNGGYVPTAMIPLTRHDHSFQVQLADSDLNVIRYIGFEDEIYPVYMRKGDTLTLNGGLGEIAYSGMVNTENKVFADWNKMVTPLRKYSYTKEGFKQSYNHYAPTLDSLIKPVEKFVNNIKTGNAKFDSDVKILLTYSFRDDALGPFAEGLGYSKRDQYPAFIADLLKTENFSNPQIWTLPFGYSYIQTIVFVKHYIYNSENGFLEDIIATEITDPKMRADYMLTLLERGEYQHMAAFVKNNKQYMVTNEQKKKMKIFEKTANLREPGGEAIDFAYPDMNGKVHHLKDYRGKVVLVDLWATWCKPCLAEQPALETLEKSLEGKNVVFISISIDTDKDKWKNMVEEKKLSGLHLYSNNQGSMMGDYEVREIPRFILIDKNGKMVSYNAIRPSDPKLKELIESKI